MLISKFVNLFLVPYSCEVVHVELAHEGREVLGFEVLGQDLFKPVLVENDERAITIIPSDEIIRFRLLFSLPQRS